MTNKPQALPFSSTQELSFTFYSEQTSCDRKECKRKHKGHKGLISSPSFQHILGRQLHDDRAPGSGTDEVNIKQWKKEQASGCCTADVCLCPPVNQLYNSQKRPNLFFFPLLGEDRENCNAPQRRGGTAGNSDCRSDLNYSRRGARISLHSHSPFKCRAILHTSNFNSDSSRFK